MYEWILWVLWFLALHVSTAALAAGIVLTCLYSKRCDSKRKPFYIFAAGVAVSAVLWLYPMCLAEFRSDWSALFKALLIALQNTIQFFTADTDFNELYQNVAHLPGWLRDLYSWHGAVLVILAPVLTFGFALSFFKGIRAWAKYLLHGAADTYVFSQINPNAVALAESVRAKDATAIIFFTGVPQKEEQLDDELAVRIKRLHAICKAEDITQLKLKPVQGEHKTFFFALREDQARSTAEVLQLIPQYKDRANTSIYLFSASVESELMLNSLDKGKLIVRRVNPRTAFINHILTNQGKVLFDSALDCGPDGKLISALILGTGEFGTEMLKALTWYCQMDNYRFTVNAFDKDPASRDRIAALCPELLDEKYNGVFVAGEAYYKIDVHACDVHTQSFREKIQQIQNISFAFVALGDDSLNIEAAVNLRILFEQLRIHPVIMAAVSSPDKCAALADARDKSGRSYDIQFVGDAKTVYSVDVIINPTLEADALALHMRYNNGKPDGFYEYEYNYKSSMASVMHFDIRKQLGIPGAGKAESELTPTERDSLASLEHRRWNAYMRSEGFIYSGSPEKASRNDLGKMHHNLVVYQTLTDDDKKKDIRVGTKSTSGV